MAVIDSDVVQMSHGECEIEMNVTNHTGPVLCINTIQNCCSCRERRTHVIMAYVLLNIFACF